MHKIIFPLLSLAALAWAVWPVEHGYTAQDRAKLDYVVSREYYARLDDIQANITPLSVEDLE